MGAFPAVSRRRAFPRPLRLTAILNGRRELLPPGTFPTLWTNIEEMVEAGEIQCIDLERPAIDVTGGVDVAGVSLRVGARTPA
jgi:hypothetical protein